MIRYPPSRAELAAAVGGVLTGAVLVVVLSLALGGCGGTASAEEPGAVLDPQTVAIVRALEQSSSSGQIATPVSIVMSTLLIAGALVKVVPQLTGGPAAVVGDTGERLARIETKVDTLTGEVAGLRAEKHEVPGLKLRLDDLERRADRFEARP